MKSKKTTMFSLLYTIIIISVMAVTSATTSRIHKILNNQVIVDYGISSDIINMLNDAGQ